MVEETKGRMDNTLEAVHVALRDVKGMKDQMAVWQHGEEGKESRSSKTHPCGKGVPLIQSEGVLLMEDTKNQAGPVLSLIHI